MDVYSEDHVANGIGIDIGGSLIKIAYGEGKGWIKFEHFEVERLDAAFAFVQKLLVSMPSARIYATGGGSVRLWGELKRMVGEGDEDSGNSLGKVEEMRALIVGLNFLLRNVPDESFTIDEGDRRDIQGQHQMKRQYVAAPSPEQIYPYLLVNIGSGVSILKVSGPESYERISGTSLGGGTFRGLVSMLLGRTATFDEILRLAEQGDNSLVDLLVGDIYGGGYEEIGLKANTIASSFGKLGRCRSVKIQAADGARAALYMVCNNIAQIAHLLACLHHIERIYFAGFFIRGCETTMRALNYGVRFWSKGTVNALFLRHEGFLGSVGALMCATLQETGTDD